MQYILAAVAAIFALVLAVWVIAYLLFTIVIPLLLMVSIVAVLIGAIAAVAVCARTLVEAGTPMATPDDVVRGGAVRGRASVKRDHAWPVYTAAQWRLDQKSLLRAEWRLCATVALRVTGHFRGHDLGGRGVGVFVAPVLLAAAIGVLAMSAVIAVVLAAVTGIGWLGWLAVAGTWRAADALIRRVRRAAGSCPHCYNVTTLPVFHCNGCANRHVDLRPGRLGALWRRCSCGTRLPTGVLRAASRLPTTCPRCAQPLREGAAVLTDIRLPVFGPMSAGKTRLIYAGMLALRDRAVGAGAVLDFVDSQSQATFDENAEAIVNGSATIKTSEGTLPPAITARLTAGRRRALLHMFDAAGEYYVDRDANSELEFLDHAQGFVFVIDPFSIQSVQDSLGGKSAPAVVASNPAVDDPEESYQLTIRRLRDYRVDTSKRKLAIAVVKADLLTKLPPADGVETDTVGWLKEAGLDNLVLSAERDFAEVRYFLVASVSERGRGLHSPSAPLAWLLSRSGFPVLPLDRKEPV
ncbi:TRAFAC clade GTPase domain-containing protein [Actinokineospora sp. G85]|uniref:TRAFAC clade GTPase domain-containing protein n=1 Tax=Actinokineospora sp. G85 TaxID=3406626 RepID=UPI003C7614EA